ncbi:MAG: S41 family peptidase [Gemmatimonadaceae bacterium]
MSLPRNHKVIIAALAVMPVLAGGFLLQEREARDGAKLFDQVLTLVSERFVDTLDMAELYEQAANGLVEGLNDPFTELLTPKELRRFSATTGGRYGGIGMQIEDQRGYITVSRVFPNTPAERAGILEGDRIAGVEEHSTEGWDITQVSDSLTGPPGTRVTVRFARPGVDEPIELDLTRAIIHIPAVPYAIMLDSSVGYVPLQQFNETASSELADALEALRKQRVRGVILDLRGNGGGILDQALAVSNLFLREGREIASVRGRAMAPQQFVTDAEPVLPSMPLVVLIDERTASASEIVAGALQDHDRALIVGTTSFGKGLVQTLYPLEGGFGLKMTTAKWFTPSGRSIQKERTVVDGQFVEEETDSVETEAVKATRPVYRSDAGRVVYGGGAITPDIIVANDTLTSPEQTLVKALRSDWQIVYVTLHDYALELKPGVNRAFEVDQSWRDEFFRRLTAAGVEVSRQEYEAGSHWVDRQLARKIAALAFGDSAVARREVGNDAPLRKAIEVLARGNSQADLFAIARREQATANP